MFFIIVLFVEEKKMRRRSGMKRTIITIMGLREGKGKGAAKGRAWKKEDKWDKGDDRENEEMGKRLENRGDMVIMHNKCVGINTFSH